MPTTARHRKVRLSPFPPGGENYARSLALPLYGEPAALGFAVRPEEFSKTPLGVDTIGLRRLCRLVLRRRKVRFLAPPLRGEPACAGLHHEYTLSMPRTPVTRVALLNSFGPIRRAKPGWSARLRWAFSRRKVRLSPLPPDGENYARSLAPPLQITTARAGL